MNKNQPREKDLSKTDKALRAANWNAFAAICQAAAAALGIVLSVYAIKLTIDNKKEDNRSEEQKLVPVVTPYIDWDRLEIGFYNAGLGPAFLKRVGVKVNGKSINITDPLIEGQVSRNVKALSLEFNSALLEIPGEASRKKVQTGGELNYPSSTRFPLPGLVIPKDGRRPITKIEDSISVFRSKFPSADAANAFLTEFGALRSDTEVEVCYCSIFEKDCRVSHLREVNLDKNVDSCPRAN